MFPPPNAHIIRNEAGEPLGWEVPPEPGDFYCDRCGFDHASACEDYDYELDDDEEADA